MCVKGYYLYDIESGKSDFIPYEKEIDDIETLRNMLEASEECTVKDFLGKKIIKKKVFFVYGNCDSTMLKRWS